MAYTVNKTVKVRGVVYNPGDILPETFTEKDVRRHTYSRRFELIEEKLEPKAPVTPDQKPEQVEDKVKTPEVVKAPEVPKNAAPVKPAAPITNNGTAKPVAKQVIWYGLEL